MALNDARNGREGRKAGNGPWGGEATDLRKKVQFSKSYAGDGEEKERLRNEGARGGNFNRMGLK